MKTNFSLLIHVLFFCTVISCDSNRLQTVQDKIADSGKAIVPNGKSENDTIDFSCVGCTQNIKDTALMNRIISEATKQTRERLDYPLYFDPVKLDLTITKQDSLVSFQDNKPFGEVYHISAKFEYMTINGFEFIKELSGPISFYIKKGLIVNLSGDIKLDKLYFKDGCVSRKFIAYTKHYKNYIKISSNKDKLVFVRTNNNEIVDALIIIFEDNDELKLIPWSSLSCDEVSIFDFKSPSVVEKLGKKKIKLIKVKHKGRLNLPDRNPECFVPMNQSDYFIQLMALYGG